MRTRRLCGDCGERKLKARGLCSRCYQRRQRRALALGQWRPVRGVGPAKLHENAPCPTCASETLAVRTHHGLIYRQCVAAGHMHVYRRAGGALQHIRRALTADDQRKYDPNEPCRFLECGRPRYKANAWCMGHLKQRQRHGEAGMRPLIARRERSLDDASR